MKIVINWNQKFDIFDLTNLKESLHNTILPFKPNHFWLEDLAIYLNYNFIPTHPSVRLRRLNLRKPLRTLGVNSDIVFRYDDLLSYKNILLSHYNQETMQQCLQLRKLGKRLFYCHSENLWQYPFQAEVFNLCDYIVCCSTKLAELTQARLTSKFTKCIVIPDMVDLPNKPLIQGRLHQPKENNDKLNIVYCGMGGNSIHARSLKSLINNLGMNLTIISEHDDADIKWNLNTYLEEMAKCDIAICPQNVELQPAKSAIKVAQAMILGLPVIASPNPAYLSLINSGENGFIADQPNEWENALIQLKDVSLREKFSLNGFNNDLQFEPHAIALKWLLSTPRFSIALINNTLHQKYLSYGDTVLDQLRLEGYEVTEFRYEDIDKLPPGYDLYLFIEVRYNPESISDVSPKILYTKENSYDLNNFPYFDMIVCENQSYVKYLNDRGFVNVMFCNSFDADFILESLKKDFIEERKKHNIKLHNEHINSFYHLQLPETRWTGFRDKKHIEFTMEHTKPGDEILDIGSADGFLSIYLAKEKRQISALEFVGRGIEWTKLQEKRHNVQIDLRKGCIEDVNIIFNDKKFDCILLFEILEHLDLLKLPWYLNKVETLLNKDAKVLISLPKQNLNDNLEHLFSPNENIIIKTFGCKRNFQYNWVNFINHGSCDGVWFISYCKS